MTSSFIIDALGVHSQLRKSLLPDHNFRILQFVVFSGKRVVSHSEFLKIYAPHLRDGNILELMLKLNSANSVKGQNDNRSVFLQIGINDHGSSGDVSLSYIYARPSISDSNPDPLHNLQRPFPAPVQSLSPFSPSSINFSSLPPKPHTRYPTHLHAPSAPQKSIVMSKMDSSSIG